MKIAADAATMSYGSLTSPGCSSSIVRQEVPTTKAKEEYESSYVTQRHPPAAFTPLRTSAVLLGLHLRQSVRRCDTAFESKKCSAENSRAWPNIPQPAGPRRQLHGEPKHELKSLKPISPSQCSSSKLNAFVYAPHSATNNQVTQKPGDDRGHARLRQKNVKSRHVMFQFSQGVKGKEEETSSSTLKQCIESGHHWEARPSWRPPEAQD